MREKPRDKERLVHMIGAIDNIIEFIGTKSFDEFKKDKILKFAVIKNLEIVGEAAYLLTHNFRDKYNSVDWKDIIGMRHVLVHGYYQIRDEIVWETVKTELTSLKEKIIGFQNSI